MKIGELANAAGCTVATIRYYEREGLLPPPARSAGNYRLYTREHADQLGFIRNCRAFDMTHAEIRALLRFRNAPDEDCEGVNTLLEEHLRHVETRIDELQRLKTQLQELRGHCLRVQATRDCGILNELAQNVPEPKENAADANVNAPHCHVHGTH